MLHHSLEQKITDYTAKNLLRTRITATKEYINFASNDYLGLAQHPQVINAAIEAAQEFGVGGTSSSVVSGLSTLHRQLEQEFSNFSGFAKTRLFNNCTLANYALLTTLATRHSLVIHDRYNHASLLDGTILSRATLKRFAHLDYADLENILQNNQAQHKIIVSESVFSMHGDSANLAKLCDLAAQYNAWLIIDDAHGVGVFKHHDILKQHPHREYIAYTASFGKALGGNGGVVAGSQLLIDNITQFARQYVYTTAISPILVAAASASLQLLQQQPALVAELQENISYFRHAATNARLKISNSISSIQPLEIPDISQCLALQQHLRTKKMLVAAIRPPSVPHNQSRLRISITRQHSQPQILQLINAIADYVAT